MTFSTRIDSEGGYKKVEGCIEGESKKVGLGGSTKNVVSCTDGGFEDVGGCTKGESKKVRGCTEKVDTINSGFEKVGGCIDGGSKKVGGCTKGVKPLPPPR